MLITSNHDEWPYLNSEAFEIRQVLAEHFLRDCKHIVDVGPGSKPVFLKERYSNRRVTVVDPAITAVNFTDSSHLDVISGGIENYTFKGTEDGVVVLGLALPEHALSALFTLIENANRAVIEFAPEIYSSSEFLNCLLKTGRYRVRFHARINLTGNPGCHGSEKVNPLLDRCFYFIEKSPIPVEKDHIKYWELRNRRALVEEKSVKNPLYLAYRDLRYLVKSLLFRLLRN